MSSTPAAVRERGNSTLTRNLRVRSYSGLTAGLLHAGTTVTVADRRHGEVFLISKSDGLRWRAREADFDAAAEQRTQEGVCLN